MPDEVLREQEAARAADLLRQWLAAGDATTSETMLLARKRESLHLAADALRMRAVPHGPVSEATLMDAAGAQDLVALLDLLASPQHGLSLARVLKSPLMGASDADLVALAVANREPAGWWDALQSLAEPSPALARARTLLRGWAEAAGELPPHDLLGRIVHEGDLHARTAAALPPGERQAGLDAIDAVLAQALLLDSGRYSTPYAFVRALRQRTVKAALPVPTGAVRLLTVHGAKGLEADTVLLLDADPEKPGNELCSLLIDWPVEAAAPLRCAFVYNESQIPPSLQDLYAREEAARRRESLNVLYVAMTRARRRLAFSATEAYAAGSGTTWWQRLEQAVPDELPLPEARTMALGGVPAPLPPARAAPPSVVASGRRRPNRSGVLAAASSPRKPVPPRWAGRCTARSNGRPAPPSRRPSTRSRSPPRANSAPMRARCGATPRRSSPMPTPPVSSADRRSAGAATRSRSATPARCCGSIGGANRGGGRRAGLVGPRLQAAPCPRGARAVPAAVAALP